MFKNHIKKLQQKKNYVERIYIYKKLYIYIEKKLYRKQAI